MEEGLWIENPPEATGKGEIQESTEEERDVIKVNIGSFVNSDFCRDSKKKKFKLT